MMTKERNRIYDAMEELGIIEARMVARIESVDSNKMNGEVTGEIC